MSEMMNVYFIFPESALTQVSIQSMNQRIQANRINGQSGVSRLMIACPRNTTSPWFA